MSSKQKWVYFIYDRKANAVKIGYTTHSPESRLKALQIGNATELELVAFWEARSREDEAILQKHVDDHRIRGEWFKASPLVGSLVINVRSQSKYVQPDLSPAADDWLAYPLRVMGRDQARESFAQLWPGLAKHKLGVAA